MKLHYHDHDHHDHDQDHDHHELGRRRHDHGHDHHHDSGWNAKPIFAWLKKRLWLALLFLYALSGVYFVAPEQQAVVTRFGRVVAKGITPGVHYHLPWPVESVTKLKVLETKRLTIGVEMPDQTLGRAAAENPIQYLTGDQNIITVRMVVQYAIKDPAAYLYRSQDSAGMIARAVG